MRPLAEYKKKRDFKITREPVATVRSRKSRKLTFVVQEHHASHLHYDFRLEWDGVLKSWSVPKGPSLDPSQRRLAVEVEDHPLDYAKFTGTIPKGEYGAGEVYRWDIGTWVPSKDVDEGLRKGRLEFTLKGGKLKGAWILVRTGGRTSTKPMWLLIKRHDEYAVEGDELSAVAPVARAAKGGKAAKGARQISIRGAAGESRSKKSGRRNLGTRTSAELPEYIPPQLCQLVTKPPTGEDWVHEIKFDGYRIQIHIEDGKVKLFTRAGHDWTEKYPSLAKIFKKLDVENAIIDGEVVWQDEEGRSNFQKLQNAMKSQDTSSLVYWAFDLLYLDEKSLISLPLIARKDRLERLINKLKSENVRYSEHFRESGAQLLEAMCAMKLEGLISKRVDRPYSPGRRDDWVKTKCTQRQEFVIGGFSDAEGTRHGFGALLLGYNKNGQFTYAGRVGTGFDQRTLEDINKKVRKLETKTSPFKQNAPRGRTLHWIKPKLVAEVAFSEWTEDGHLRVPVFHGLRSDKAPDEVTIERPKKVVKDHVVEPKTHSSKARSKTRSIPSNSHLSKTHASRIKTSKEVPKVTHPDRMIYAKEKLTKLDVAKYYRDVAKWMVPHIADRPLSLLRCTDSAIKGCFFNKHFPTKLPEHLIEVPEKGKQPFFALDSAEGLAAIVQYGALEIHPWNCHREDIEAPDQIVLDLDPDPTVPFTAVKEAAFELRDVLKQLGLKTFVKITGGKGLHVQFPFEPKYDWDDVKNFAKTICLEMVSRHPHLYTANMAKKARHKKIFLDYLRNGRGSTAIAPYSLRAREKSAVAMPVSWDELKKLKASNLFTLEAALKYLSKRKRDPWRDYFATKQKIALLS